MIWKAHSKFLYFLHIFEVIERNEWVYQITEHSMKSAIFNHNHFGQGCDRDSYTSLLKFLFLETFFSCTYLMWRCFPKTTNEDVASSCVWIWWWGGMDFSAIRTQEHSRINMPRRNGSSVPNEGGMEQGPGGHLGDRNVFSLGTRAENHFTIQRITEICIKIDTGQESLFPPWELLDR